MAKDPQELKMFHAHIRSADGHMDIGPTLAPVGEVPVVFGSDEEDSPPPGGARNRILEKSLLRNQ
eukprot:7210041-Pyramimonas_sp.AAC.1